MVCQCFPPAQPSAAPAGPRLLLSSHCLCLSCPDLDQFCFYPEHCCYWDIDCVIPVKNIPSMASTDSFCLQWNEFGSSLTKSLRSIRSERDFFDVTLACEDNQIFAHKLILAASSPFFRKILKANPHNHPLLYLKGVKYKELMSILEFLYMGQVRLTHCCDNETMSNSCSSSGEHR